MAVLRNLYRDLNFVIFNNEMNILNGKCDIITKKYNKIYLLKNYSNNSQLGLFFIFLLIGAIFSKINTYIICRCSNGNLK